MSVLLCTEGLRGNMRKIEFNGKDQDFGGAYNIKFQHSYIVNHTQPYITKVGHRGRYSYKGEGKQRGMH